MLPSLTVTDLEADRGGRPVFSAVSFVLGPGEALSVVGPNGAGKSTLLRVLAGLLRPSAGAVSFGDAANGEDRSVGERAHYIGHVDALKTALTAAENLAFAAATLGRPTLRPADALRRHGLAHVEDLPSGYLSAGQRRRVALARLAIAFRPLWLLDEPLTALDRWGQAILADVMRAHLGEGGLIVAATHAPLGLDRTRELRLGSPGPAEP